MIGYTRRDFCRFRLWRDLGQSNGQNTAQLLGLAACTRWCREMFRAYPAAGYPRSTPVTRVFVRDAFNSVSGSTPTANLHHVVGAETPR